MIDKERGNIVKMDRHMYVKVAFHGNTLLDTKTRTETYGYESYSNANSCKIVSGIQSCIFI